MRTTSRNDTPKKKRTRSGPEIRRLWRRIRTKPRNHTSKRERTRSCQALGLKSRRWRRVRRRFKKYSKRKNLVPYCLAAAKGSATFQFILGHKYKVEQNDNEAVRWYRFVFVFVLFVFLFMFLFLLLLLFGI